MSPPFTYVATTDWLSEFVNRLLPWAAAAIISASAAASPATDTIGLWNRPGHVTELSEVGTPYASVAVTTVAQAMSFESQILALRDAQLEARLALRLLQHVAGGVGFAEVDAYLAAIDRALGATPKSPTAGDAPKFAHALRAARTRLVEEACSFGLWLKLTEALVPSSGPHRVPTRFVRWKTSHECEPLTFSKSDSRVRRAVVEFVRDDAHPGSGQG